MPEVQEVLIDTTQTLKQGSRTKLVDGYAQPADAVGDKTYGYCIGFKDDKGFTYDLKSSNFDGTYTEAVTGDTYVSASDNTTTKKIKAIVVLAKGVICSAKLDAAKGYLCSPNMV